MYTSFSHYSLDHTLKCLFPSTVQYLVAVTSEIKDKMNYNDYNDKQTMNDAISTFHSLMVV